MHIRATERRFYVNRPYWRSDSVIGKSEGICCRGMMWVDEKPYLLTTHEHPNVMADNVRISSSIRNGRNRRCQPPLLHNNCCFSEEEHQKGENSPSIHREAHGGRQLGIASIRLAGLPDIEYLVQVEEEGPVKWLKDRWEIFLDRIRDGERQLVLLFEYNGNMEFTIKRFNVIGQLMLQNQKPPNGYEVDRAGTLTGLLDSFMWDA
ncbi:uncharacterized protein LOC121051785 [Rosa chinensis]|uniref:uncharacterized protein LOC121051785 n=1 Tax=Rosa chinensis TaxID=74649 RepID=UPI001AD940AB|nr:uncharacterized protein LOC121051785 [Rosa chinensis]